MVIREWDPSVHYWLTSAYGSVRQRSQNGEQLEKWKNRKNSNQAIFHPTGIGDIIKLKPWWFLCHKNQANRIRKSHCFASPTAEFWVEQEGRGRQHQGLDKRWTFSYLYSNLTNVTVSRRWQLRGIDFLSYIIPLGAWISCMAVKVYSWLYMRTSIYIPLILLLQPVSSHSLWASHHPPGVSPVMGSLALLQSAFLCLSSIILVCPASYLNTDSYQSSSSVLLYHLALVATAITKFKAHLTWSNSLTGTTAKGSILLHKWWAAL